MVPDPALVVLVGAAGSGKSAWARSRYREAEIVSSDELRAVVGSGPHDLDATEDAFALLDQVVDARTRRGLTTVIDTLGLDADRRLAWRDLARRRGLAAVAVLLATPPELCRQRNAARDRPVPARALTAQLRRARDVGAALDGEGWDHVERVGTRPTTPAPAPAALDHRAPEEHRLRLVLQVSRFPWEEDPAGWLRQVAVAAADAGFHGLALMDHLVQIPQVDRPWTPIPEPFVTLGLLAGLDTGLQVGPLCTPVSFRAPGILAKTLATLDVLSGGRTFCGIGAGWWEREHRGFGLPFASAGARLDLLEEAVETMRALWAPGTKEYVGERVRLPETTCYPRPVGRLPVVVGGGGERRTLRIAARWGDACNIRADLDTVRHKTAVLHRHCDEVGRPRDEVEVTVIDVAVVGHDREDTWRRVERLRGRASAAAYAARHHAGTVEDHRRRHQELAEAGVSTVFLALPDLAGPDDVARLAPLCADRA